MRVRRRECIRRPISDDQVADCAINCNGDQQSGAALTTAYSFQAYTVRWLGEALNMNASDHDLLMGFPELSDEEKHQRTLAGLADVDAGRTIPHEEIVKWAKSLFDRSDDLK